uniref:Replication associated protein n=1 Tax=Microviridae sp. ctSIq6 TaxID=2824998 RepID=A0A8S5R247_9VIRU|nr:MAG TPA: Replication associated protein [Microviridae sp. ctSIq6]
MDNKVFKYFNKCENPRIVQNKYTGEFVKVDCGECSYCLIKKSDRATQKCNFVKFNHKYCYFVTLTYNSQYVPKMSLTQIDDYMSEWLPVRPPKSVGTQLIARMVMDSRVNKEIPDFMSAKVNRPYMLEHLHLIEVDRYKALALRYPNFISKFRPYILRSILRKSPLMRFKDEYFEELVWMLPELAESLKKKNNTDANGAFPQFKGLLKYVNVRDYQLFAKRLRKYLSKKIGKYEKIHSYVVSEYSPKTFRPHFHILFFFDSDEIAQNIRQAVYQSWKLGRVDTQLARDNANSYVANYLNSVVSVPFVYKAKKSIRPRSRFSNLFGYEEVRKGIEKASDKRSALFDGVSYISSRKFVRYIPSGAHIDRLFPRFTYYDGTFLRRSEQIYSIVQQVLRLFARNEPFKEPTARNVSEFICWWCEYNFRQGCRIEDFPDYIRDFLHVVRLDRESFLNWNVPIGKISRFFYRFNRFEKMKGSLRSKLKAVSLFYDYRDYESLKNQLSLQELVFGELGYSDELFDSFYVKPHIKVLKNTYTNKWRDTNYREVHYFRVKHKMLNDENNVFL